MSRLVHRLTEGGEVFDEVSFVYEQIELAWIDPPVIVQDDWATPVVLAKRRGGREACLQQALARSRVSPWGARG